jgi:hypothetical protein
MQLFVFGCLIAACLAQALNDPRVFNLIFYGSQHPEIIPSFLKTHWLQVGIPQGLQGCATFHSQQYLQRYPDLKFGTNYQKAILHYLNKGYNEGRLGYVEGGAFGRYTISQGDPSGLFISASDRTAGAVDSVVWNNYEFINSFDHGRELQIAYTFGTSECNNPTQAGNNHDGLGPTSSSVLQSIGASGNVLTSEVLPAYWLEPGEHEAQVLPNCQVALNTKIVSDYLSTFRIVANFPVIEYDFNVTIAENHTVMKIEAPTGYMTGDFTAFMAIKPNGTMFQIQNPGNGKPVRNFVPIVNTTPDLKYAVGVFPLKYPFTEYPVWHSTYTFVQGNPIASSTKWNSVWNASVPVVQGDLLEFKTRICIGDYEMVLDCMSTLMGVQINRTYPVSLASSFSFNFAMFLFCFIWVLL